MGSIIKILILYKSPFWRNKKFSGEVVSDCIDGPTFNVKLIKIFFIKEFYNLGI